MSGNTNIQVTYQYLYTPDKIDDDNRCNYKIQNNPNSYTSGTIFQSLSQQFQSNQL